MLSATLLPDWTSDFAAYFAIGRAGPNALLTRKRASTRALAIPEILERVLQRASQDDWLRTRAVAAPWRAPSEALIVQAASTGWLQISSSAITVALGEQMHRCNVLGILQRCPALGRHIKKVHLPYGTTPSKECMAAMRTFRGVVQLHADWTAETQPATLHEMTSLRFPSLRKAVIDCCPDATMADPSGADPVLEFIRSHGSLSELVLVIHRVRDKVWFREQVSRTFAQLRLLERLGLSIPEQVPLPLARILPGSLEELKCYGLRKDSGRILLEALKDATFLPFLGTLPQLPRPRQLHPQWRALLPTWGQRRHLQDVEQDLQILQIYGQPEPADAWPDHAEWMTLQHVRQRTSSPGTGNSNISLEKAFLTPAQIQLLQHI